jgi:hypothetical protein
LKWFTQEYQDIGDLATEKLETEIEPKLSRGERRGLEEIVEAAGQLEEKLGDLYDWYFVEIDREVGWAKQHAELLDQQLKVIGNWTWNDYKPTYPGDKHNEYSGLQLHLSDWAEVILDGEFSLSRCARSHTGS